MPARPSTSPATPTTPTARPPDAPIAIRWSVDAEGPTLTPEADTDTDVEPAADETTKAPSRIAGKRTAADGPAPSASTPSTTGHEGTLTPGSERAASTARSAAPAGSDTSAASARAADLALRVVPGFEAQLAARAKELLARGQTEIRVTLDPPSLGRLRVRLLLTDTDAVAHISTGSPEAAALLHRERAELARAFEQQGFSRVEVHVDAGAGGRSGEDADRPAPDASAVTEPEPVSSSASRPAGRVDLFV
jgi:flagellar hook-length control protein FliK